MLYFALVLLLLVVILGAVMGFKYLLAMSFTTYHAQVVGKQWEQLEPRMQAIIVGMLRVIGGGFLGLAATLAWLAYALFEGARWAPWALATIGPIALLPALAVALNLRKVEPRANTPVVPCIAAIGFILLGAGLGLLASWSS
jgi:hypothetical protein